MDNFYDELKRAIKRNEEAEAIIRTGTLLIAATLIAGICAAVAVMTCTVLDWTPS
jgi:hypothetical protein